MESSYFDTYLSLWEVILDDGEIKNDSPKMLIAARSAVIAAKWAKLIVDKEWRDNSIVVLSVKYIDDFNGVCEDEA